MLIAVDGATPEHINELRARGQLPNIDRLIREGSWGPMESLAARRRLRPKPRRGYWSPIVWASMATGKIPDKHGIVDFLLPLPGTSFAWAGQNDGPPFAEIRLPEISGASPHTLKVRLRNYAPNGAQNVELTMNGQTLGSVELTADWKDETLAIPHDALRPAENRLTFAFERQSRPADHGPSKDQRSLAGAVAPFSILDSAGEVVVTFDPIYGRFDLIHGFHQPEAKVVEAQSTHMRAAPVWNLLGDAGHPVGIVGYWTTWPAYPVNGFLVSSHLGVRGKRQKTSTALTWPPELTGEIEALEPDDAAIAQMTAELYPQTCRPLTPKELRSFERILWQDAFYQRIARKLLPTMDRGFFTVYFESIDASGHLFLPFRHGKARRFRQVVPTQCATSSTRPIFKSIALWASSSRCFPTAPPSCSSPITAAPRAGIAAFMRRSACSPLADQASAPGARCAARWSSTSRPRFSTRSAKACPSTWTGKSRSLASRPAGSKPTP